MFALQVECLKKGQGHADIFHYMQVVFSLFAIFLGGIIGPDY
jgi:hypothetical protein